MAELILKVWSRIRKYLFYIIAALIMITLYTIVLIIIKRADLDTANKLPCEYFDSMNITGGSKKGDYYVFRNIKFSKGHYATVNSLLGFETKKVPFSKPGNAKFIRTMPYQRGCLDKNKKYIRLCSIDDHNNDNLNYWNIGDEIVRWNLTKYTDNPIEYVVETCGRTTKIDAKNVRRCVVLT